MLKNTLPIIAAAVMAICALAPIGSAYSQDAQQARQNTFWWPNLIDLSPLRQHAPESNP